MTLSPLVINVLETIYVASAIIVIVLGPILQVHQQRRLTVGDVLIFTACGLCPFVGTYCAWHATADAMKALRAWDRVMRILDFPLIKLP